MNRNEDPWTFTFAATKLPAQNTVPTARPEKVGRNKLAQFRHRGSAFAIGLPELRKLVPAYGPRGRSIALNQRFLDPRAWPTIQTATHCR